MAIGKQFCQEAMMEMLIRAVLEGEEKSDFQQFIQQLMQMEQASPTSRCYLLRNQILQAFANYCQTQEKPIYYFRSSALGGLIHAIHEMLLEPETIWLVLRTRIASQEIWQLQPDLSEVAPASIPMLLAARDRQGRPGNKTMDSHQQASPLLEINFAPFHRATPNIDDPRNIGQGLSFLNHYLCDQLSNNHDYWVEALFSVLRQQEVDGISLLIGDRLPQAKQLHEAVVHALQKVGQLPPETPYVSFHPAMQELGLEPGWGNNAGRVYETFPHSGSLKSRFSFHSRLGGARGSLGTSGNDGASGVCPRAGTRFGTTIARRCGTGGVELAGDSTECDDSDATDPKL
jgi:sucrose synthase